MELETQSSKYPADHRPPLEEKIISLFEPDMLLPALYLENFHRKTPVEPERRLMLAVLEDAINPNPTINSFIQAADLSFWSIV